MKKLLQIPEYFADTHEPSLHVVHFDHGHADRHGLEKTASEAWDYIQHVKPKEGKRYILVIAMGAGEYWGANKNGDYFVEADLLRCYKNFETTYDGEGKINGGALIFKHHKNKLAEGHPWFGTVAKSFYNHRMHHVELLLEIWGNKAQDLIDRIDNGDVLAVSMGVRIPFDTCSVCGNKAKKKEEYCEHLKQKLDKEGRPIGPSNINKILPDGRQIYAINGNYDPAVHPNPLRFFDISIVFRPADQTGYMLKKVAAHMSYGDYGEDDGPVVGSAQLYDDEMGYDEKVAAFKKLSAIDKIIRGEPIAAKADGEFRAIKAYKPTLDHLAQTMKPLDGKTIENLSAYPMNKILSTLSQRGVLLTTPEFICLAFFKLTGMRLDAREVRALASAQGEIFEALASEDPEKLAELESYEMFEEVEPDANISNLIEHLVDSRDLSEEGIIKKAADPALWPSPDAHDPQFPWGDGKGMLHSEYRTDPKTGTRYAISQTAIDDATVWEHWGRLAKALGTTALLGGLYAYLKSQNSALSPIAGLATLAMGAHQLRGAITKDESEGYLKTESGEMVPKSVMMMEKKAGLRGFYEASKKKLENHQKDGNHRLMATIGPVAATSLLRKYYEDRLMSGTAGTAGTPFEQNLDTAGKWSYHHPLLVGGAGVVGSHWALNAAKKLKMGI